MIASAETTVIYAHVQVSDVYSYSSVFLEPTGIPTMVRCAITITCITWFTERQLDTMHAGR